MGLGRFANAVAIVFFFLLGASVKALVPESVYQITGVHKPSDSVVEYRGILKIRDNLVEREIEFFSPDLPDGNEKIRQIWSGRLDGGKINFVVNESDYLTRVGSYTPKRLGLEPHAVSISIPAPSSSGEVHFSVLGKEYSEVWTPITGPIAETHFYQNQNLRVDVTGEKSTVLVQIGKILGVQKVIDWYRGQPETKDFVNRNEFQTQRQFYQSNFSDFQFYRNESKSLRIYNLLDTPLALTEAQFRQRAFAHSLSSKAEILLNETLIYDLNEAGQLELAVVDIDKKPVGRRGEGDSALWSAIFAWSELLRYQSTRSGQALNNFLKILNSEMDLLQITADPKEFARTIVVSSSGEDLGPGWIQGRGVFQNRKWLKGGNNDMYKGLLLTLTLAHQIREQLDPETLQRIKNTVQALPLLRVASGFGYNRGMAFGLRSLWSQDPSGYLRFSHELNNLLVLAGEALGTVDGFYFGGIADWSGIHLQAISNVSLVILSQSLARTFTEKSYLAKDLEVRTLRQMQKMIETYRGLRRDFLPVYLYALLPAGTARDLLKSEATHALESLRQFPAPRFMNQTIEAKLFQRADWCLSAWPKLPWKSVGGLNKLKADINFERHIQGAVAAPLEMGMVWSSPFVWKDNPFNHQYGYDGRTVYFSADYLILYWLGISSGLLNQTE